MGGFLYDHFGPSDHIPDGVNAGDLALVILDLDDADVLAAADDFLPPTGMEEGRPGKPRSHRYYLVDATKVPAAHTAGYGGTAKQAVEAAAREDQYPGP